MAPYHVRITTLLIICFAANGRRVIQSKLSSNKGSQLLTQEQRGDTERRSEKSSPTSDCKDLGSNCARRSGYCASVGWVDYMQKNCKASCGLCATPEPTPAPCLDLSGSCGSWQGAGYCDHSWVAYMQKNCKASCGLCATPAPEPTPTPTATPTAKPTPAPTSVWDCKDLSLSCGSWQDSGYCDHTYVSYMQTNCAASCGLCATPPSECGVLSETMDRAKAINVVLVGSKFGQDETHWKAQVDRIYGKFDAYPPLHADVVEQLNIYYVRTPVPGDDGAKCWYGCGGTDRLLCCEGAFFERHVTGKCGSGLKYQIIVVHNDEKYGGAGGRIGTTSIASSAALIAIHELGHSMFELGDEYDSGSHRDWANCDRSAGCPKWADMIGQFEGAACVPGNCGGGEYNAPGSSTMMKHLSSPLGPVNERITCCKYLLETMSYPEYCKPFDSGSFDLKLHCETHVWKRQVSLLESSEGVVTGMAQGIHYMHVDKPVEWQLVKTKKGEWRCVKLGIVSPGEYPRDEVEGDVDLPRTGDRILVEVLAEDRAGKQQKGKEPTVLRKLFFNEFDTVEIPPLMEDEDEDRHTGTEGGFRGAEASEERSDINVILSEGEACQIARQPKRA